VKPIKCGTVGLPSNNGIKAEIVLALPHRDGVVADGPTGERIPSFAENDSLLRILNSLFRRAGN
jgi:hypothetical protein